jgi:hypothetical protein
MTSSLALPSRRRLLAGFGALLVAAPAIVRSTSIMPVKALVDSISLREITQYDVGADQLVTRLDVLYGGMHVRPEWADLVVPSPISLDEYSARVLAPMIARMQQSVADAIMSKQEICADLDFMQGSQWSEPKSYAPNREPILLSDLVKQARAT